MAEEITITDYHLLPRTCNDANCPTDKHTAKICPKPALCPDLDFRTCIGESEEYLGMPVIVPGTDGHGGLVNRVKHYLVDKEHPLSEDLLRARVFQVEDTKQLGRDRFYVVASRERDVKLVQIVADAWNTRDTDYT